LTGHFKKILATDTNKSVYFGNRSGAHRIFSGQGVEKTWFSGSAQETVGSPACAAPGAGGRIRSLYCFVTLNNRSDFCRFPVRSGSVINTAKETEMHLFMSLNSPYARKVRCLIAEAGRGDAVAESQVNPRDPNSGFWDLAPAGRIPALRLDDGTVLTESDIIAAYLDRTLLENRMVTPVMTHPARARILSLANTMLDTGMVARVEKQRLGGPDSAAFVAKHLDAVRRIADRMEMLVGTPGDTVDYADIATVVAIDWNDLRHPELGLADRNPVLARFAQMLNRRPAFAATRPVG
jgi:glutathione S-transferase